MDFSEAPQFGRRTGICKALEAIEGIERPIIVETGTTRGFVNGGGGPYGDGWATLAWGWFCQKIGGRVYTVDLSAESLLECERITHEFRSAITYVCDESAAFLAGIGCGIDLLYLDSADDPEVCLREFKAAEGNLKPTSVVLIDDTDKRIGKGVLTVPYMMKRGWKAEYIVQDNERQVLLMRSRCFYCGAPVISACRDLLYCEKCLLFRRESIKSRDAIRRDCRDFMLSACSNEESRMSRLDDAAHQLEILHRYAKPGIVYDVGAAGGFFMHAAQKMGWVVRGNDLSAKAVEWAKQNYGLDIFCGFLEDDVIALGSVDAFVLWNTLEHLDDPVGALKVCHRSLRDGGVMMVKVPDKNVEDMSDVDARYEGLHLTEFSRNGLVKMLEEEGFQIEFEETDWECGKHISVVATKKPANLMMVINELLSMMKKEVPFCLVRFNDGEMMAVRGPGVCVARGDQPVDESLSNALRKALIYGARNYWIGVPCEHCWPEHRKLADTYVPESYPHRTLAVVLTNDNWLTAWRGLLESVGDRPVWIVSGADQNWSGLESEFNFHIERHITIPSRDSWSHREKVWGIWKESPSNAVVFISCGPLSRVLSYRWWRARQDCTVLDVGSTFDPFTRGVKHGCHEWNDGRNKAKRCPVCNMSGEGSPRRKTVSVLKRQKRLLVGYPHGIGDCILATPALRERKRFTGDHITFAMLERFKSAELFVTNPHVDDILWLPDPWNDFGDYRRGFDEVRRICENAGNYDEVVFVGCGDSGNKLADMMKRLGVGHSPQKHTEVYIRPQDVERASRVIPAEPYGFIHGSSPSLPSKNFPKGYARKWLVREKGLSCVVEVGVDFQEGEMPIGAQFAIMRSATAVCLIDSAFYHACCAMDKRVDLAYFNRGDKVYQRVRHLHPVEENVVFELMEGD